MIPQRPADKKLIGELLEILDEEIALLNTRSTELDFLASAVVDRDDDRLVQLLAQMEQTHQGQAAADVKLDALRRTFAQQVGCPLAEMKLSRLAEQLDDDDRLTVEYRRQQIVILAEQLRSRHITTAMMLQESARINRLLLESLFPKAQPVTTYSTTGRQSWRPETGLLDAEM